MDELSDIEVSGGGYFTLFPNFHPWWSYDEIVYRFRPYKDEPEMCLMETYLLRPFKGARPKPAPTRWLGLEDSQISLSKAVETIGRDIYWQIPNDYATMVESRNNGVPLILQAPRAKLTRAIEQLAQSLDVESQAAGEPSEEKKGRKGLFGLFSGSR